LNQEILNVISVLAKRLPFYDLGLSLLELDSCSRQRETNLIQYYFDKELSEEKIEAKR
jgi:hypothetical protein